MPDTFKSKPFPDHANWSEAMTLIYKESKNVFLIISRNKNRNLMVYEALTDLQGNLLGIEQYWLDLEPSYVQSARAKGRNHERDELSTLDYFGYGMEVKDKYRPDKWQVQFKQCPQNMTLRTHKGGVSLYRKNARGEVQKVHHLHLHDRSRMGFLPTVDYVDITAFDVKTKQRITEKFTPN